MVLKFVDKNGIPLQERLYIATAGLYADIYNIKFLGDESSFSAESYEGKVSIEDHELFARQLVILTNPLSQIEFAASKLEERL